MVVFLGLRPSLVRSQQLLKKGASPMRAMSTTAPSCAALASFSLWATITLHRRTAGELLSLCDDAGVYDLGGLKRILLSLSSSGLFSHPSTTLVPLTRIRGVDLGLSFPFTYKELMKRARTAGLGMCPPLAFWEVALLWMRAGNRRRASLVGGSFGLVLGMEPVLIGPRNEPTQEEAVLWVLPQDASVRYGSSPKSQFGIGALPTISNPMGKASPWGKELPFGGWDYFLFTLPDHALWRS